MTLNQSAPLQWLLLVGLSAVSSAVLLAFAMPASLLLGPIIAGIVLTAGGGSLRIPGAGFVLAQGFIGCMVARMLPVSVAAEVAGHWPVFVGGTLSVLLAAGLLGALLTRLRVLPGSTALWGLSPGGAATMVVMAEAYGADTQLVAFMQYLRVVVVAASAAIVARIAGVDTSHGAGVATQAAAWFPPIHWVPLLETIALCVLGAYLGVRSRIQAGALLVPMAAAILLTRLGWVTLELPRWLLSVVYAVLGWRIGLGFTRPLLLHAARVLPRVLACALALVVFCAGLGGLLVVLVGVDPLTAYLATSPGGADSVAIIASATQVDASFVMAMQMARLLAVLLLAPAMTRMMGAFAGAQRAAR